MLRSQFARVVSLEIDAMAMHRWMLPRVRSLSTEAKAATGTVGFVGLGIMGEGMSRNLIKGGKNLVVWNRSTEKCEKLASEYPGQVTIATSPQDVIQAVNTTFAMLSTPDVAKEVYEMDKGVLAGISAGKRLVDCATLAVEDMERLESQVLARGGRFLEAPVSGSKGPAAQGQLIFLTAGDKALYEEVADDLDAMGKAKFFLGECGYGTRMKLCVNMTMGTMLAAYGEALGLAGASGLDASTLLEVLQVGVCNSPLLGLKGEKMLAGDHAPNFPLKHAQKDVHLAIQMGQRLGMALPIAVSTDDVMKAAMVPPHEMGDLDFSVAFETQKAPAA